MLLKCLVLTRKYVLCPFDKLDYQKTVDLIISKIDYVSRSDLLIYLMYTW